MDTKQIINNIWDSVILDPISNKTDKIVIIDIKATVCSFKYEVYSDKGYCLMSSYHKKVEFGSVSDYGNRLIIPIRKDQPEAIYFIRFYEIKVIKPAVVNSRFGGETIQEIIELNDPVFCFYHIKSTTEVKPNSHVDVSITDDEPELHVNQNNEAPESK